MTDIFTSLTEALTRLSNNTFSLVILDPNLTDKITEIEDFYQRIKHSVPETKLCLLSYYLSVEKQQELKNLGIEGYCNKGIDTEALVSNLERIEQGEFIWPEIIVNQLVESYPKKSQKKLAI